MPRPAARSILTLACLLALGAAEGVRAQDAEARRTARDISACLDRGAERADFLGCIGEVSSECQLRPGGGSTVGISECNAVEAAGWDVLLNQSYRRLMEDVQGAEGDTQPEGKAQTLEDALKSAQRAWIAFRDADCDLAHALWGEGSMRQIAGSGCLLERTAERVIQLREAEAAFRQ